MMIFLRHHDVNEMLLPFYTLTGAVATGSEEPTLGKGRELAVGHDEVIERPDVDERERLLQRLGQELIGTAGLGHARRMVVRKDHRRGIARERGLDDFARINAGLRERAAEEFVGGEQPVLAVEEQADEHFVWSRGQEQPKPAFKRLLRRVVVHEPLPRGGLTVVPGLCMAPNRSY